MKKRKIFVAAITLSLLLSGMLVTVGGRERAGTSTEEIDEISPQPTEIPADRDEKVLMSDLEPREPIRIESDEDFEEVTDEGNGSKEDPWIIEGYEIDGRNYDDDHGAGIFVGNTTDHFIIRDCNVKYISHVSYPDRPGAGIVFRDVENGSLEKSLAEQSRCGLYLEDIERNEFVDNTIRLNDGHGVYMKDSENNTFEDMEVRTSDEDGFYIEGNSRSNKFIGSAIRGSIRHAIHVVGSFESNDMINLTLDNNDEHGIYITDDQIFADNVIEGINSRSNLGDGIRIRNSIEDVGHINITNFEVDQCAGNGVWIGSFEEVNLINFTVSDISEDGIAIDSPEEANLINFTVSDCGNDGVFIDDLEDEINVEAFEILKCNNKGISVNGGEYVNLTAFEVSDSGEDGVLVDNSGEVNIFEFTVSRCDANGVSVSRAEFINFTDLEITDCNANGLFIEDSDEIIDLTDFKVTDCKEAGIYILDLDEITFENVTTLRNGRGIHLKDLNTGDIEEVSAKENDKGIYVESSSQIKIFESIFNSNDQEGIHLEDGSFNRIRESKIFDNDVGIKSTGECDNSELFNNTISNNNHDGILLTDQSYHFDVENNSISNNDRYGIYIGEDVSQINPIANNTIKGNSDYGIYILGDNNQIYNNKFILNRGSSFEYDSNHVQAYDDGDITDWYDDDKIIGNYWLDWMEMYNPEEDDREDIDLIHKHYSIDGGAKTEDPYPLYTELYELSIYIQGKGSVEIKNQEVGDGWTGLFEEGEDVELKAMSEESWNFVEWTGDVPEDEAGEEITITMDEDKNLTAIFTDTAHDLTVELDGGETVTVEWLDEVENVTDEETFEIPEGVEVTLTAEANEDWEFVEWTGTDKTGEEITITMDEDKNLTAIFTDTAHDLTVELDGGETVTVEWLDKKESVSDEDTFEIPEGVEVTLTAEANEDWEFVEWTGTDKTGEEITITMDEDKEITAHFEELTAEIEVSNFNIDVDGLEVTITADVENIGNVEGSIDLEIDGEVVDTLTVEADSAEEYEYTHEFDEDGEYTINFGDGEETYESETVDVDEEEGLDIMMIAGIILIMVIILAIIGYTRMGGREEYDEDEEIFAEEKEDMRRQEEDGEEEVFEEPEVGEEDQEPQEPPAPYKQQLEESHSSQSPPPEQQEEPPQQNQNSSQEPSSEERPD